MTILIAIIILFAPAAYSQPFVQNQYRQEVREMTLKNHRSLSSYSKARKVVMQQIHLQQDERGHYVKDVYCQKDFRKNVGPNRMPSHNEINIEHTWPQSRFNKRQDRLKQKVDLHHLYPSDSRSNSSRGNSHFSEFHKRGRMVYRDCPLSQLGDIEATGQEGFEPPREHKGNVARALFYFSIRYNLPIPAHEEFFLRQWNLMDPVDEEERQRNDIVETVQGNRNPFIDEPELMDLIADF